MSLHRFVSALVVFGGILLTCRAAEIRVDELDLTEVVTGWGKVGKGVSVAGLPLKVAGTSYTHGIGVHAPSSMTIQLDGKAQGFRSRIGLNDEGGKEEGLVEFRILADGKQRWSSGPIKRGESKSVNLPLDGVRRLTLEVDPHGENFSDHANWIEPVIETAGKAPKIIHAHQAETDVSIYPAAENRKPSPGNTTYYLDPVKGNDDSSGTERGQAWKTFARLHALKLAPGDRVRIAPGIHPYTLMPSGEGSAAKPVVIEFLPGRHEFEEAGALRRAWFVSNSCDDPLQPRPVGILLENIKHFRLEGGGATGKSQTQMVLGGRMIEFVQDHCEQITWSGLAFDLKRPTVSEFRVEQAGAQEAVIRIAEGSTYAIQDGRFAWTGDLGSGSVMVQQAIPGEGRCWRVGVGANHFAGAQAKELSKDRVLLTYAESGKHSLQAGRQWQFRHVTRDTVSAHHNRCRDLVFRDCTFHALTGMGIVSQFCENLSFERVHFEPPVGTIRTCPAWADGLHFSGCRGKILVSGCRFSGFQDDPINVHGTHLRIVGRSAENQLRLRFMQPQTYGFAAFQPGDEVAVISHQKLRELQGNPRRKVKAIAPDPEDRSGKVWLLTLDGPAPEYGENDVIDNLSWYPEVTIRDCQVAYSSCRGFLITTRGASVIENCTFDRTAMASILVEDDAEGWFESGPIQKLTIKGNRFIGNGIEINPHTSNANPDEPVHENIQILDNLFLDCGISAKNTRGLVIQGNRFSSPKPSIRIHSSCANPKVEDNRGGISQ